MNNRYLRSFRHLVGTCLAVVGLSAAAATCDVNNDRFVDSTDINLIAAARNSAASGATDARDPDGDRIITVVDARICTLRCTRFRCSTQNGGPVANAGPAETVTQGATVRLNGTGSTDPDGDMITFQWRIFSKPSGSAAVLTDANSVTPTFVADKTGIYVVQLIVNDGKLSSAVASVTISTANSAPIANAGTNLSAKIGNTVTLNGSGSNDTDGDPLAFSWSLPTRPTGSIAALTGATTSGPSFIIDKAGTYTAQLIVNDGKANSNIATVTITTVNTAALANAGMDQTILTSETVTLNGAASTDIDGDALTFVWSITNKPVGSVAQLSDVNATSPSFVADLPGTYIAQLVINDGKELSAPDTVVITTLNSPPRASAGPNQTVPVGATTIVDGSGSTDVDGDLLTYEWALLSKPASSAAMLSSTTTVRPAITIDRAGSYIVQLIVNDGKVNSAAATITINTSNSLPVSNAGLDQTVALSSTVALNGGASSDIDGNPLTYLWALTSKPLGSTAVLTSATTVIPSFVADKPGVYIAQLFVNDGFGSSPPDTVQISTINSIPVANAGSDQTVDADKTVSLNGSNSLDADGHSLRFTWSILSKPASSKAILSSTNAFNPTFNADVSGDFVIQLIVDDGQVDSLPDTVVVKVRASNQPPVANAGPNQFVAVGSTAVLSGVGSNDPEGDPLTYIWSISAKPPGSVASLTTTTGMSTSLIADVPGTYAVQLIVNDGKINSTPAGVTVTAKANGAPVVNNDSYLIPQGTTLAVTAPGVLSNDSDPEGDALSAQLVSSSAGGTLNLLGNGGFSYAPQPAFSGVDKFSYQASDGKTSTGPAGVTINVKPDVAVLPLDLDLTISPQFAAPGSSVTLTVVGKGGVGTLTRSLQIDGAKVALDGSGNAVIINPSAGVHRLIATVSDPNGVATKESFFTITNSTDTTPGIAAVTSPTDATDIYGAVNIVGTASDANLALYQLLASPAGANQFTEFARGTSSITNGTLGRFDPTTFANGFYDILLRVIDVNGKESQAQLTLQVIGDQKVGNFQVSFEDLNVDASGIPIIVTRTYSTARKNEPLDFGYGWSVDYQNVKIQNNKVVGRDWQLTSTGTIVKTWCVKPIGKRTVSVTLPDGKVERFDFSVSPECQAITPPSTVTPVFTARIGTRSKLTTPDPGLLIAGLTVYDSDTGDAFDPTSFTLTTEEGFVYQLDKGFGIRSVTDLSGNTLTYSSSGIIHSAGKNVGFQRDAQGRITKITDPNGKAINYGYNDNGDLATVTDRDSHTAEHRYNRTHGLVDFTDPRGVLSVRNVYDDNGKLIEQIDAQGNKLELSHDVPGHRETVKDRRGFSTVYEYDASGNVTKQTDALGGVTAYTYDARGNELTVTDPVGKVLTRTFDANDRVTSESDLLGNTKSYKYNLSGKLTQITDALGNKTDTSFAPSGSITQIKDATGATTAFAYDGKGHLTHLTDALGQITTYGYDSAGRKTQESDPLGNVTSFTYDANGKETSRSTSRTISSGVVTVTTSRVLDGSGRVVEEADGAGAKETTTYNSIGKVATSTDKRGNTTSYSYDVRGHLAKTTYSDGTSESIAYDANGNEIAKTDRVGRVTKFQFDALNRLTRTIYPDGSETTTIYDAAGQVIAETNERGQTTSYEYDVSGRRTKVTDALGNITQTSYDANGNVATITDALSRVTAYTYDGANRRIKTTFDDGSTIQVQYDAAGRKTQEIDQTGVITSFAYNAARRLTQVTDPLGGVTSYSYDELGNKLSQTDALGHITRWEYNNLGRVSKRTLPAGQSESFVYDASGNVATHTDFNGAVTAFQYDSNSQIINKTFADSKNITYSYTATGKVADVTDTRGVTRHFYDARERLVRVENPDGSVLSYVYDAAGNRSEMMVTQGTKPSRTTGYTYDALNRLATVVDPEGGTTIYGYDAVGNRLSIIYPNGTRASYIYNRLNRLIQLTHTRLSDSVVLARFDYTLASNGRRVKAVESVNGVMRTVDYTYDTYNRLTQELITDSANGNRNAAYVYDAVGNRLTQTVNGVSTNYTYDSNDRLQTEVSGGTTLSYTYDANGNTLNKKNSATTLATYIHDFSNRLTSGQVGGTTSTFTYDADDMRVGKSTGGVLTKFIVDKNQEHAQVVEERNGTDDLVVGYVHGDDLIKQFRGGQGNFYHADGVGSIRLLSDVSGNAVGTYLYDAFGTHLDFTGSTINPYLYTGEYFAESIALQYNRARWYDASIGRFLSIDPINGRSTQPLTLNKYLYANANPVNITDPSGLFGLAEMGSANAIAGSLNNIQIDVGFNLTSAMLDPDSGSASSSGWSVLASMAPFAMGSIAKGAIKVVSTMGKSGKVAYLASKPPYPKEIDAANFLSEHLKVGIYIRGGRSTKGPDFYISGVLWELKTLEAPTSEAVRRNIKYVLKKQGSRVIIDGRFAGLTEAEALLGAARAAGRGYIPDEMMMILPGGKVLTWP